MSRAHARPVDLQRYSLKSYDGTRLMVYRMGHGPHRWLLPPGLGTPVACWRRLAEEFADRLTILTWDLRGTFASQAPADLSELGIDAHVRDAECVARQAGWLDGEGFVTGGWSLGIETGLEFYRRFPEHVRALALINGSYEHIFKSALGLPHADKLLRSAVRGMTLATPVFAPMSRYLLGREWTLGLLMTLGIVAGEGDAPFFAEVLREFRALDFSVYFKLMLAVNEHSARDVLPLVGVPTLITAGSADLLTPLAIAREMHDRIATSELFIVPGGTHYTIVEYPELINLRLDAFMRKRVFPETWD